MSIKLNIDINKLNIGSTQINKVYLGTQLIFGGVGIPLPDGQVEYTTPGSYSWEAPAGVTEVSVVAIGGGGLQNNTDSRTAGAGGGGLGWKNTISVTPGQSYDVEVGTSENDSYFINASTVKGGAGESSNSNTGVAGGTYVGDGGGNGGVGGGGSVDTAGGSGGAGGYSGNGGFGATGSFVNDGGDGVGGAGGGAAPNGTGVNSYYGGGVGIYGEGANGAGGDNNGVLQGGAGSGGAGNLYGGGNGGSGAVRIIWGIDRAFPSTNTADI